MTGPLVAGAIVLLTFAVLGFLLYRERRNNITLASDNKILDSRKAASDSDILKYRKEAEIHAKPKRNAAGVAAAWKRLRDKGSAGS